MNNKNYKAIAEILNKPYLIIKNSSHVMNTSRQITERLADYFEKEDLKTAPLGLMFYKRKFLKECGIDD